MTDSHANALFRKLHTATCVFAGAVVTGTVLWFARAIIIAARHHVLLSGGAQ